MKKLIEKIVAVLGILIFGLALAVLTLEWMAGCGETYIDSKGVRHQNECLFINR